MSIPYLTAPRILLFTCAARILYRSSQALLQAGSLEADMPLAVAAALEQAEAKLQALDLGEALDLAKTITEIVALMPPAEVLGLVQNWIDEGSGPDLETFLEHGDPLAPGILRYPSLVVCPEALAQLIQRIPFPPTERAALDANLKQMEARLHQVATQQQVDPQALRAQVQVALSQVDPDSLLQIVQAYFDEEVLTAEPEVGEDPTFNVVGPLLFIEVADHLLGLPEATLTPDQRLDLQTNRATAEVRLGAMKKLGRIEDPDAQKAQIQNWIQSFSPPQLLQMLDRLFEIKES